MLHPSDEFALKPVYGCDAWYFASFLDDAFLFSQSSCVVCDACLPYVACVLLENAYADAYFSGQFVAAPAIWHSNPSI